MNLEKEDLVARIEVEGDLRDFVCRLCDTYLKNRNGDGSAEEWELYSGIIIGATKEKLKLLPPGYWRPGIFSLAEEYFSDAIKKGEISPEDCESRIRQNLDPWGVRGFV